MTGRRALVASPSMPEFDREGGSRDVWDLIGFLLLDGWSVTCVARVGDDRGRYARLLRQLGVAVHILPEGPEETFLRELDPELVVLAFWHLAESILPEVRNACPAARVVVSSIDVHFVRNAEENFRGVADGRRSFPLDGYYGDELLREVNTYAAADGVLTVSAKEAALLNDLTGDSELAAWVPVTQGEERGLASFDERNGILFVGNFRHLPNVEAVEHLCRSIVPRLDADLLATHPISVVGNAPDERVHRAVAATPGTRLVGWVPSLTPYLRHARACVVPLLHGAGVKGKLVRSLAAGTPAVASSVGVEGLGLSAGVDVLVADDPERFAACLSQLLIDRVLWERISDAGYATVTAVHGNDAVRARLTEALDGIRARPPKSAALAEQLRLGRPTERYAELIRKIHFVVRRDLPVGSTVVVVSKGDDDLIAIEGMNGRHFPQGDDGKYQGWAPPDVEDVIARLEHAAVVGDHYLLLPDTSAWWLDHYVGLRQYLDAHYRLAITEDDACTVWERADLSGSQVVTEARRPIVNPIRRLPDLVDTPRAKVLVIGVCVTDKPNYFDDIAERLSESACFSVTQQWVSLGEPPRTEIQRRITAATVLDRVPKFELLNRLLAEQSLDDFEYVVTMDDDIVLPFGFIDQLLLRQADLDFALAQPARTSGSWIDQPIVEQQHGVLARRTRFVEIGPVTSFHRSTFDLVFPFNLTSPMGWGYERVWAYRLEAAGLRMGIVDAVPVDHTLRKPVANYSWDDADSARSRLLVAQDHLELDECFRVLEVFPADRSVV